MNLRCFLLLLPVYAGVTHAEESAAGAEPVTGFYAGVAAGRATVHRARFTRSDVEAHDTGLKVMGGYRIFEGMAVEASYIDYGKSAKDTRLAGEVDAFNVAIVGLIRLRQWDLFGKAGLGAWEGTTADRTGREVRDDDVDPILGMGAQYRAGRFAIRAEAEAQQTSFAAGDHGRDGDWVSLISLGASFRF